MSAVAPPSKLVTLAVASDERYLPGAIGTLASARIALGSDTALKVHFLHDALPEACQQRVRAALERLKGNTVICFHQIEADFSAFPDFFFPSKLNYARLILPKLLPSARIIYLDVDLLILKNLFMLLPGVAEESCLMAVKDSVIPTLGDDFPHGIPIELRLNAPHFNSGLMYLDLPKITKEGLFDEAIRILSSYPRTYKCRDQSALNYACNGEFTLLDDDWNRQNHRDHFDPVASIAALEDRSINVHFVTKAKPWMGQSPAPAETMFRTLLDIIDPDWRGTNAALADRDPVLPRQPSLDRLRPTFFRLRGRLKNLAGRNGTSDDSTARYWARRIGDESRLHGERARLQALYADWRDQIEAALK